MGTDVPLIVLDTHAWVWWTGAASHLSRSAVTELERADAVGISTMSFWEVARLERAGRMRLDRDLSRWLAAAVADGRTRVLPVTRDIALTAAAVGGEVRDPADQIIYATAVEHGARLLSPDTRLQRLDPARVVW